MPGSPHGGAARALTLGAVSGLRTFTAPGVLAARGRWGRGALAWALPLAAAGELAADKTPAIPPRSDPPSLAGRVLSGAAVGAAVGGARGAGAGAAGAAATTYASERLRSLLGARTGLPDLAVAAAEDALAVTLAAAASADGAPASEDSEPAEQASPLAAVARGLAAAAIGTAAMTSAQIAYLKATGSSPSDVPERIGRRVVEGVLRRRVPRQRRAALGMATHAAYGTSWGLPLGLAAGSLRHTPPASVLGAVTGVAVWSAGLAALPAAKLAPPPWEQPPSALVSDLALHLVYGGATGAAYRALGG